MLRLGSAFLLGRPDEGLVEADVPGPGDREGDRVGDVGGLEFVHAREALDRLLLDAVAEVVGELGVDGAGLDQRRADLAIGELLAEGLAESADPVLGQVVDAGAGAGDTAGEQSVRLAMK